MTVSQVQLLSGLSLCLVLYAGGERKDRLKGPDVYRKDGESILLCGDDPAFFPPLCHFLAPAGISWPGPTPSPKR